MRTPGWFSEKVEKTCVFFVGIVVLRGMSTVITPPAVSNPRLSGVTSKRRMLSNLEAPIDFFPQSLMRAASMAAP